MGLSTTSQNRFFMTRQIANVLEDLDRQILTPASISVLYGVKGIGKSRLLRQFVSTRLHNNPALLLHFSADGTYHHENRSFSQLDFANNILQLLEAHSVLILDQFELAQSDLQRCILTFWSTSAKTRDIKLVLCGSPQIVTDLAALTTQFNGNINSVELKPLSDMEREQYVAIRCCPPAVSKPNFPRHIKKLIRQSKGLFGNLESICRHYSGSIDCEHRTASNKFSMPFIALAIVVTLMVTAFVVKQIYENRTDARYLAENSSKPLPITRTPAQDKAVESAVNNVDEKLIAANKAQLSVQQNEPNIESSQLPSLFQNRKQSAINSPEAFEVIASQEVSVLQQRLKATEYWLAHAEDGTATLQVMTLSVKDHALESLRLYLERLKAKGIELNNIFIYSAPKQNTRIYGVLYGSYSNRQQARQNLNALPEILKLDRPIPRTVIGIKQEIKKNKSL